MSAGTIVSASPAMQRAMSLVRQFAPTRMPVLLVGATGTGKEVIAREIHAASGRVGRLVDVNCPALPRDLVEGQLFGHRRGAFSGALADAIGLVEAADRGTLFLDELSSMPLEGQTKLLRVLEENAVMRLGETRPRTVDVRFIAAVQADSRHRLDWGRVRPDLVHRLGGIVIELSPLCERRADVIPLAIQFAREGGRALDRTAEPILTGYSWPGNVRELRLAIERAGALSGNGLIHGVDLVLALDLGVGRASTDSAEVGSADGPRTHLVEVLARTGWNADRAAAALGIGRTTLFRRLKAMGLTITAARQYHQCRYGTGTGGTRRNRVAEVGEAK